MDNPLVQYWLRIFSAAMLIKMATDMIRQAEKLVTANVKARYPEVADVVNGAKKDLLAKDPIDLSPLADMKGDGGVGFDNGTYNGPVKLARDLEPGMTINDRNTPRTIVSVGHDEHGNVEVELPGDLRYTYNPDDAIAVVNTNG